MKYCNSCNTSKAESDFCCSSSAKDGLQSCCKSCYKFYNKTNRTPRKHEDVEYLPEEKRCSKCGLIKLQSEFNFNIKSIDGLKNWCKDCRVKYESNGFRLENKYGITEFQYDQMIKDQNYKCIICGKEIKLVVDHDHKTMKIRGLLCGNCNKMLGFANDNVDNLQKAIEYLNKQNKILEENFMWC